MLNGFSPGLAEWDSTGTKTQTKQPFFLLQRPLGKVRLAVDQSRIALVFV
jgi:hypothetical protein